MSEQELSDDDVNFLTGVDSKVSAEPLAPIPAEDEEDQELSDEEVSELTGIAPEDDTALEEEETSYTDEFQGEASAILQLSESADDGLYDLIEAYKESKWKDPEEAGDVLESYADQLRQKFPGQGNKLTLEEAMIAAPVKPADVGGDIEAFQAANIGALASKTNPVARAYEGIFEDAIEKTATAYIQEINRLDDSSQIVDKISRYSNAAFAPFIKALGLEADFQRVQRSDSNDTLASGVASGGGSLVMLPYAGTMVVANAGVYGYEAYKESRRAGGSQMTAAAAGTIEAVSQAGDIILDKFLIGKLGQVAKASKASTGKLRAILYGAYGEGGTEVVQDKLSDFAKVVGLSKDDYDDVLSPSTQLGFASGAILGGGVAAGQQIANAQGKTFSPQELKDALGASQPTVQPTKQAQIDALTARQQQLVSSMGQPGVDQNAANKQIADLQSEIDAFSAAPTQEANPADTAPPPQPQQEGASFVPAPIENDGQPLVPSEAAQYEGLETAPSPVSTSDQPFIPQALFPAYQELEERIKLKQAQLQAVEESDLSYEEIIPTEDGEYRQIPQAMELRRELEELKDRRRNFFDALRDPAFPETRPRFEIAVIGEPVAGTENVTTIAAPGGEGDVEQSADQPAMMTDANEVLFAEPDGTISRVVEGVKKQPQQNAVIIPEEIAAKLTKLQEEDFEGEPVAIKIDALDRNYIDNPFVSPDLEIMPKGEVNPDPVMIPTSDSGHVLLTSTRENAFSSTEHVSTISRGKTSGMAIPGRPVKERRLADQLRESSTTHPMVRALLNLDSKDTLSNVVYTPTSNAESQSKLDATFALYDNSPVAFANDMLNRDWGDWTADELFAAGFSAEALQQEINNVIETDPELAGRYAQLAEVMWRMHGITRTIRGQQLAELKIPITGNTVVLSLRTHLADLALARAAEAGKTTVAEIQAVDQADKQADVLEAGIDESLADLDKADEAADALYNIHDTNAARIEQEIMALDASKNPDVQSAEVELAEATKAQSEAEAQASKLEKDADALELAEAAVMDLDNKIKALRKINTNPTKATIAGLEEKRSQLVKPVGVDPTEGGPKEPEQIKKEKATLATQLAKIDQQIAEAKRDQAQEKARLEAEKTQKLEAAFEERKIARADADRLSEELCG